VEDILKGTPWGDCVCALPRSWTVRQDRLIELVALSHCCLLSLNVGVDQLRTHIHGQSRETTPQLPVAYLYRDYLNLVRLKSKDVIAGEYSYLLRLAIDYETARFLASLGDEDINNIAFHFHRPEFRFSGLLKYRANADLDLVSSSLPPTLIPLYAFAAAST
jgi:hypothetical protein